MIRKKLVILPRLYDAAGNLDESWFVFYSYRNPKTDKMQRFRLYDGFKKLHSAPDRYAHAQKIMADLKAKIKAGWTPFDEEQIIYEDLTQYANVAKVYGQKRKSNLTLNVYLSEFLQETKIKVTPKTFESYQSKTRLFALWLERERLSENDISAITTDIILKFFDFLINERKLQGRTIQKYGQNLNQMFKSLLKKKKIFINPMPEELPRVANTVDFSAKPIRKDDIERFKKMIQKHDPQLWLAIQFEFYCFIRPGRELRLMKLQWIDFFNGTITIPSADVVKGNNEKISKNGKAETVLIPGHFLKTLLHDYQLDKYHKSLYVFGRNRVPGPDPMGANTLRDRFNKYRDAMGLSKDYKFYSWKHTGGVNASNAGIPVKDIQMQMRHHSLDVTDKYLRKMKGIDSDHLKNRFPTL